MFSFCSSWKSLRFGPAKLQSKQLFQRWLLKCVPCIPDRKLSSTKCHTCTFLQLVICITNRYRTAQDEPAKTNTACRRELGEWLRLVQRSTIVRTLSILTRKFEHSPPLTSYRLACKCLRPPADLCLPISKAIQCSGQGLCAIPKHLHSLASQEHAMNKLGPL